MMARAPLSHFELGAYLILVAGVVGDHISTGLALARDGIYESNPFAKTLMQNGLWGMADVALIILIIGASYLFLRVLNKSFAKYVLLFPALSGLIRIVVTLWNFSLII